MTPVYATDAAIKLGILSRRATDSGLLAFGDMGCEFFSYKG
jgi:hypothetical protein